jgi:hypothetical protein
MRRPWRTRAVKQLGVSGAGVWGKPNNHYLSLYEVVLVWILLCFDQFTVNTFPKFGACDFKHLILTSDARFVHLMAVQSAISTGTVKVPFTPLQTVFGTLTKLVYKQCADHACVPFTVDENKVSEAGSASVFRWRT